MDIDDDNDGIPDAMEYCHPGGGFACLPGGLDPGGDADNDGIPNYLDANDPAVPHGCPDADGDGICDKIAAIYDTDGDGIPNHLDLDSDNDGIPDLVEAGHGMADADGDGVIDGPPAAFGQNGLFNSIASHPDAPTAVATYTLWDWDGDGVPDFLDLDSDNDGINDVAEAGYGHADTNNDGRIGDANPGTHLVNQQGLPLIIAPSATGLPIPLPPDEDSDGIPNWHDLDSDGDGVRDVTEANLPDPDFDGIIGTGVPQVNVHGQATGQFSTTSNPPDTDGDGKPDYLDLDADGDGIPDADECPSDTPCRDWDGDGIPDFQDMDRDNDGIPDYYECETSTPCPDTDGDGIPDVDDLDTDGDGLSDTEECPSGPPCPDSDGDGIPDWRQYTCHAGTVVANIEGIGPDVNELCEGGTVVLNASSITSLPDSVTYTWTGPNNFIFTDKAEPLGPFPLKLDNVTTATGGVYALQVFTVWGCPSEVATTSFSVAAAPPTPALSISNQTPCQNEPVVLSTAEVIGTNISYNWYFNGQVVATTPDPVFNIPLANPVNNGTWAVQVSDGTCESAVSQAQMLQVNMVQAQAPTLELSADVLCQGGTLELTSSSVQGNNVYYQWYFNGGSGNVLLATTVGPSYILPNVNASYTGAYTVVASANGCISPPSVPEVLSVGNQLPEAPGLLLSDDTPCLGGSLTLNTTAYPGMNVSYVWMSNGPLGPQSYGSTTTPQLIIPNVTLANGGSFIVIAGTPGCPPLTSPVMTVSVNTDVPPAPVFNVSNDVFCETETLILNAGSNVPGAQYQWLFDNGSGAATLAVTGAPVLQIPEVTAANTGTYSVSVIGQNGCASPPSGSVFVTVTDVLNQTPVLTAASSVLCEGTVLELSGTAIPGAVYEWFYMGSGAPISLGVTQVNHFTIQNITPANAGSYFVQASVSGCVSPASNMVGIQVNTGLGIAPTLSASANVLCVGETLILNSTPVPGQGVQYEWYLNTGSGPVLLGTTAQPTFILDNLTAGNAGLYSVTATVNGCTTQASNIQQVAVSNVIGPAPYLTANANVICEGSTLVLNSSIFAGANANYQWYFDNGGGPVLLATTIIPTYFIQNITAAGGGIYTVVIASGNCETQPSNAQAVEVTNELADAPSLSVSSGQLCLGETLVLNSSIYPGTGISYQWYHDGGNGPVLLAVTTVPTYFIQNLAAANAGSYTVVAVMGNCNTQPSNVQWVTVTDMTGPAPQLTASAQGLCEGATLVLNSSVHPGTDVQYEWFFDGGSGPVLLAVTTVPTYFIQHVTPADAGIYFVMALAGGCETPASNLQAVTVTNAPDFVVGNMTQTDGPACPGSFVQLHVTQMQGATYQWNGPLGFSANVPNPVLMNVNAEQTGTYTATVTLNGCTFNAGKTTVLVQNRLDAVDDTFEVLFNQTLLGANPADNDLTGNVQGWSMRIVAGPSFGTALIENGLLSYSPRPNYFGTDELVYEICNLECPDACDRATVRFNVLGTDGGQACFVPNIITPNGDGMNDYFAVPCLADTYPENNVKIFNRWGDLVFDQDRYRNDWDGSYKGNPLPPGTYFYLIQLERGNSDDCLRGYFTITR